MPAEGALRRETPLHGPIAVICFVGREVIGTLLSRSMASIATRRPRPVQPSKERTRRRGTGKSKQQTKSQEMIPKMKRKSDAQSQSAMPNKDSASIAVQPKPKVFLVDFEDSATESLRDAGINATAGSFGTPYRVEISSAYEPVRNSARLPGYAEQEIIFIDLASEPEAEPVGDVEFALDSTGVWIRCNQGVIDPRFRAAEFARKGFERIVAAGGVVVVFATSKSGMSVATGRVERRAFYLESEIEADEWGFLGQLGNVHVSPSHGEEIVVSDPRSLIGKTLTDALPGMRYECTLQSGYDPGNRWTPLAKNKFGEFVALGYADPSGGAVMLLPQVDDKAGLIDALLTNVFPELFPHLYPGIEKGRWTHLPEYELDGVVTLEAEREDAIARHTSAMAKIDADISELRSKDGWLHDLLTQTGDGLVEAVMAGLAELGFQNVVDMDKIRDRSGKPRREDLQVRDVGPTLVIDVKGISNFPGDEDAMQAFKHAALIMREQKRTDVYGLSLINHQRHLPPLARDNSMPFRKELVDVALQNEQGLMTTWDLYRMVVNKRRNSWTPEDVKPVLYGHGRITPVPAHYVLLGHVTHVWKHAFGVDIENGFVRVGDTIAIEFDVYFEEVPVPSLRVDDGARLEALAGDKTGIPWPDSLSRPKVGMALYIARRSEADATASSMSKSPPN